MVSFPQASPPTPCAHTPSPIRATCPAHLILLYFTTRTILGKEYRSLSSSLCNFLHSPVTSSLFLTDIAYLIPCKWRKIEGCCSQKEFAGHRADKLSSTVSRQHCFGAWPGFLGCSVLVGPHQRPLLIYETSLYLWSFYVIALRSHAILLPSLWTLMSWWLLLYSWRFFVSP
jgi:hypothetical protein